MSLTFSEPTALGVEAPSFTLPIANAGADGREGETRSLDDYADAEVLVVVFTCNHCPYARHVEDVLVATARTYHPRGVAFVAISSNDPAQYPEDSFEAMGRRAREKGFPFAYLFDETQEVARAYGAVCTPDVFVFDQGRRLVYRGRIDETRPGQGTATGAELRQALEEVLEEGEVTMEQYPAMGCNIKWRKR